MKRYSCTIEGMKTCTYWVKADTPILAACELAIDMEILQGDDPTEITVTRNNILKFKVSRKDNHNLGATCSGCGQEFNVRIQTI